MDPIVGPTGAHVLEQLPAETVATLSKMLGYAARRNLPRHSIVDPEDIAQEAFAGYMHTFSRDRYLRTRELIVFPNPGLLTLFAISRNKAVSEFRTHTRRAASDKKPELIFPEGYDGQDFADALIDKLDNQAKLRETLGGANLSPLQASILMLRHYAGDASSKEVAALHGVSDTVVRVNQHRLFARFRAGPAEAAAPTPKPRRRRAAAKAPSLQAPAPSAPAEVSVAPEEEPAALAIPAARTAPIERIPERPLLPAVTTADLTAAQLDVAYARVRTRASARGVSAEDIEDLWSEVRNTVDTEQVRLTTDELLTYLGALAGKKIAEYL